MYAIGHYRLKEIKEYLHEFGCADTETLHKIFFPSLHRTQVVLKHWCERKELARIRLKNYIYFIYGEKPKDLQQCLNRSRFDATFKDLPKYWKINRSKWNKFTYYTCINTRNKEGIKILPVFSQAEETEASIKIKYYQDHKPVIIKITGNEQAGEIIKQWISL